MGAIYDQCSEMNSRWDMEIMPAIIEYGIQSKVQGSTQALATGNAKAWQCLIILVEKLKPKGNKSKTIERLSRVICVSEVYINIVLSCSFFALHWTGCSCIHAYRQQNSNLSHAGNCNIIMLFLLFNFRVCLSA
jgi:hypothetical protein